MAYSDPYRYSTTSRDGMGGFRSFNFPIKDQPWGHGFKNGPYDRATETTENSGIIGSRPSSNHVSNAYVEQRNYNYSHGNSNNVTTENRERTVVNGYGPGHGGVVHGSAGLVHGSAGLVHGPTMTPDRLTDTSKVHTTYSNGQAHGYRSGPRDWSTGLCSCTADVPVCLCVTCCPFYSCYLSDELSESCVLPICLGPLATYVGLRALFRERYRIRGTMLKDAVAGCFCLPCVMCQLKREHNYVRGIKSPPGHPPPQPQVSSHQDAVGNWIIEKKVGDVIERDIYKISRA